MITKRVKSGIVPLLIGAVVSFVLCTLFYEYFYRPSVKMSQTGVCHVRGSAHYYQTRNYDSYLTLDECLSSGGRSISKR